MKYLVFWGLLVFILLVTLPVNAAVCHNFQGQKVCIVNIQRSAKKHWEYRVILSVDGDIKPLEVYNCRSRYRVSKDKTIVSFEQNDIGTLICNTLNHRNHK